jgi:2-methylisocitrate lyase-like PEP mutase family enzyme
MKCSWYWSFAPEHCEVKEARCSINRSSTWDDDAGGRIEDPKHARRSLLNRKAQVRKAEDLRALHHDPKLLVLPNIWDPLGARLLQGLGYPAVATASAAVAYSLGYADGQRIRFDAMLEAIRRIVSSVEVPVTADVERGYGTTPEQVAENIRQVLRAGAVGVNLEDSLSEGGPLQPVDTQCARIRAVRVMAEGEAVPLVINARIDTFVGGLSGSVSAKMTETIERAKAYLESGADCVYPITVSDIEALKQIRAETGAPINVYASRSTPSMRELEGAGISRLSLGPNLIKASLTTMRNVAVELLNYGSYGPFTDEVMTSDEVERYVSKDDMPEDK